MAQKSWTSGLPQEKAGAGRGTARAANRPRSGRPLRFQDDPPVCFGRRAAQHPGMRVLPVVGREDAEGGQVPAGQQGEVVRAADVMGTTGAGVVAEVPAATYAAAVREAPAVHGCRSGQGRRTRHRSPKAALPVSVGPGLPSPQPPPPALLSGVPATGRTMGSRSRRPADAVRARTHRPRAPGPFCPVVLPRCRTLGGEPWAAERPKRRFIPTCAIWYASRGRVSLIPTVDFPSITQLERSCGLTCRG